MTPDNYFALGQTILLVCPLFLATRTAPTLQHTVLSWGQGAVNKGDTSQLVGPPTGLTEGGQQSTSIVE